MKGGRSRSFMGTVSRGFCNSGMSDTVFYWIEIVIKMCIPYFIGLR